jgi:signal transduction histidine kinase
MSFLRLDNFYEKAWKQKLLKAGSLLIGVSSAISTITFYIYDESIPKDVLIYLIGIILFSGSIFIWGYKYTFTSSFILSTILFVVPVMLMPPDVLLHSPNGTTLLIPTCLISLTTSFRFGALFSGLTLFTFVFVSITGNEPWSSSTIASASCIVIVTGLLWITHELIATLHTRNEQLKDLAIANERNRIAREIHDSLGHHLSIVNMQLRGARAVLTTDPDSALESITEAQQMTKDALQEVRHSIEALRQSPTATRPLPDVIAKLVARNCAAGIPTTFTISGTPRQLPLAVNDALYSAVQEGLTNMRKHADAQQGMVRLDYTRPGCVALTIVDDGQGAPGIDGGFGLMGVRERLQQVGGRLQVVTAPGKGLRLVIEVAT